MRAKSLPSTPIGGGASVSEVEASVRIRQEPAPLQNGVRYRGLMKNTERLALLFGLGNLLTAAGTTEGVVVPAAILTGFPACASPRRPLRNTKG